MSSSSAPIIYRIDDIEVDPARGCLRRAGQDIHLKPKAFQLLLYLVTQRDRLVNKEELLATLWKDAFVGDDVLTQCIAELRRALGDSSRNSVYLKTIPRRGYRFVAEVQEVRTVPVIATEQITTVQIREEYTDEPRPSNRLVWVLAALLSVSTATAVYLWLAGSGPPAAPNGKRQIAVLRFENRSGQSDLDWLRDGLPDMLTTTLSRSASLDVLSREQVSVWMGRVGENGLAGALEIARRSHAQTAVLGSFQKAGANIRIDARVYDGRSGSLLAAESITVDKPDRILTQVDYLSARLAEHLAPKKDREDRRLLSSLMTDNLEAYRYYTLGVAKAEALQIDDAVELLRKAVALDPAFAMAYARIGYAYAVPGSRLEEGRPFLEKAFQMSGKLTEKDRRHIVAWYAIANQDYQEAIRGYSALIAAYPSETEAYYRLALVLRGQSRHEEGVDALRQALAIDPEDPKLANGMSTLLSEMGRHEEAIEMAERYVAMAPADANAHDSLGLAYLMAGQFEKSQAELAKALELKPEFEMTWLHRGIVWFQLGREREALREFEHRGESAVPRFRSRYWQLAAWVHWRRGRIGEAEAAIAKYHQSGAGLLEGNPVDNAPNPLLPPTNGRGTRWGVRWNYFDLAQRARAEKHPDEMLARLRDALHRRTSWAMPEPLEDALADAYLESGKLDDAIAEYERALKLFPGMARARFHLAQAYRRSGREAEAKAQFRAFVEMWKSADRDLPEMAEALQWARL